MADNSVLWDFLFAGPRTPVPEITVGGRAGVDPFQRWELFLKKLSDADAPARGLPALVLKDQCVLCRHHFGTTYEDPLFGTIDVRRNRLNRYYCNQCDYFIRVCPGQATLVMPILVVDVNGSRRIRKRVGDLGRYAQLLRRYQERVAGEIQKHLGLVLNTIGDAVLAAWPSGFTPMAMRNELGWDDRQPARIPALCAIEAARALARIAPSEFDGENLPFRGAVDTTRMVIFAVTTRDPAQERVFEAGPGDDSAAPLPGVRLSDIPTGPAAIDIAGEAVEVASALASHRAALGGRMYISERTDVEAAVDASAFDYVAPGPSRVMTRTDG